jgi:hypothetical protein
MVSASRSFMARLIHSRMPAAVGYMPFSSAYSARAPSMSSPAASTAIGDSGPLM